MKLKHASLFSGFGGFDLAAEWMGWENIFHCEWNKFCQRILRYWFLNSESHEDITKTCFKKYANRIDVLTGGFPCQPYSLSGKRKGKNDKRHLWPEMLRAVKEIQPRWVVGENVLGIVNWGGGVVFHEVQTDLETEGYEVFPYVLPACAVNAPHRRDRTWFIAYRVSGGRERNGQGITKETREQGFQQNRELEGRLEGLRFQKHVTDTDGKLSQGRGDSIRPETTIGHFSPPLCGNTWENFPTQSPICGRNDGLPEELDGITFSSWRNKSIEGYGNAVVPHIPFEIFKAIERYEKLIAL